MTDDIIYEDEYERDDFEKFFLEIEKMLEDKRNEFRNVTPKTIWDTYRFYATIRMLESIYLEHDSYSDIRQDEP